MDRLFFSIGDFLRQKAGTTEHWSLECFPPPPTFRFDCSPPQDGVAPRRLSKQVTLSIADEMMAAALFLGSVFNRVTMLNKGQPRALPSAVTVSGNMVVAAALTSPINLN